MFPRYHEKIHPFVPILTRSKEKLLALMHQSTREVQEVFLHAFYRVTHSDPGRVSSVFQKVKSFESAQDLLLHHCRNPPMAPVTASNIITMQTMLLMIIDADSRGPDNLVLGGGVQKQTLLYHASKFSRDLAKICGELPDTHTMIVEPDLDVNIVRRCRVMVIILSRWHSIGFADAGAMISDEIISRKDVRLFESGPETISSMSLSLRFLLMLTRPFQRTRPS